MTLTDILHSVRQFSENDKLALSEATAQMLREALGENGDEFVQAVAEMAAPCRVSDGAGCSFAEHPG